MKNITILLLNNKNLGKYNMVAYVTILHINFQNIKTKQMTYECTWYNYFSMHGVGGGGDAVNRRLFLDTLCILLHSTT